MRVRKVVLCLLSFRRSFFVAYFERYPQFHVNKILQIISWGEIIKGETHLPVLALQRMGEKETLTRHESQVRHRKKKNQKTEKKMIYVAKATFLISATKFTALLSH